MKKLFLVLFCVCTGYGYTQVVVANEKQNMVYCGVENPLSALAAGYPCQSVVLTTDNGKIEKTGCGRFIYKPAEVGDTKIRVWIIQGKKLKKMGEWPFRCKRLLPPVAILSVWDNERRFRPWNRNTVYKSFIRVTMSGIRAVNTTLDYDAPFMIISYTLTGLRRENEMFKVTNYGSVINADKFAQLDTLKSGDHLLISDIKCIGPDKIERTIKPLEFIISE